MIHLAPFLVHTAERNGSLMLIKRDYFFFGGTDLFYTAPDRFGPGWGTKACVAVGYQYVHVIGTLVLVALQ